jgi:hypothetical protein
VDQPVLELGPRVGLDVQRKVCRVATGLALCLLFPQGGEFTEAAYTVGVLG